MDTLKTAQVASGLAHLTYGLALKDKQNFRSPFAFDAYDLWFGADFDFLIDSLLDDFLSDIETDISSVDSSNLSEQHSAQISAQSSADRQALIDAGISLAADNLTSETSAGGAEESRVSTPTTTSGQGSTTSSASTDSDGEVVTTTLDHSHSKHGGYHENSESRYSGRSASDEDDSGLSDSEGTSQRTGEASTLSSVSIKVKQYRDVFANVDDGATVRILDADDSDANIYATDDKQ